MWWRMYVLLRGYLSSMENYFDHGISSPTEDTVEVTNESNAVFPIFYYFYFIFMFDFEINKVQLFIVTFLFVKLKVMI